MMARTPVFLVMIGTIDAHNGDHTHTHNDDHIHTRNDDHQKSAYIIMAIMAPVCLFRAII